MGMTIDGMGRRNFSERRTFSQKRERKPKPEIVEIRIEKDRVPGEFLRSEQQRAEIAAMNRAIQDTEHAMAIIAAAREGLQDVAGALNGLDRGLERISAGENPEPPVMEKHHEQHRERPRENSRKEDADGSVGEGSTPGEWIKARMAGIDWIAESVRFGELTLLDGSVGCSGLALGDGLIFIETGEEARSSPPDGYEVLLSREPTRATLVAEKALVADKALAVDGAMAVDGAKAHATLIEGAVLSLRENGREATYTVRGEDTSETIVEGLRAAVSKAGLPLVVELTGEGRLLVQHCKFGSAYRFRASSTLPGILSPPGGGPREVANGQDIAGTINRERAVGDGALLTGAPGNITTAGLTVRYTGLPFTGKTALLPRKRPALLEPGIFAGRVIVARQALAFHLGGFGHAPVFLRLDSVRTRDLGRDVETESGFASLAEIGIGSPGAIQDSRWIVAASQEAVAAQQRRLGELSQGRLLNILSSLQVQSQNLEAAASSLPDQQIPAMPGWTAPAGAWEAVRTLSERIGREGAPALMAQNRPSQNTVQWLLNSEPSKEKGTRLN